MMNIWHQIQYAEVFLLKKINFKQISMERD